jgi:molybdopterin-guanine dinucleotide biosynthesis protein A
MRWVRRVHPELPDVLSVPTDTPFLPNDLVARLSAVRLAADHPIAVAVSGGRAHPVISLWPVALADALEDALRGGVRKIGELMAQFGVAEAVFDTADGDPFFNVNSRADLVAAEAMLAAGQKFGLSST